MSQEKPPSRSLSNEELSELSRSTVGHYEDRARDFWDGTRDHDVSQNMDALLRHLEGAAPLRILDFGCGPGRDLMALKLAGHHPVGLDGSPSFCEMAREHSGCEVLQQNMIELELPLSEFDGVFANASLFHVPTQEVSRVIKELRAALKPRGVLFASNPRGDNREGYSGARYGAYHDHESWTALVEGQGFTELEHYFRPPGLPRDQQPWLATVFRRVD
ncbi:MAG: SAM-dependent methyltransferase [Polyangiales bacterium]|jgi:SAM-dependent methyltransferase